MIRKISEKQKEKNKLKAEETRNLHNWFLQLWDSREQVLPNGNRVVRCFETGNWLSRDIYRENSCCYSHILEKSNYPHLAMIEENVVIVHPDQHTKYETRLGKTPKQDALREKLKEKYDRNT